MNDEDKAALCQELCVELSNPDDSMLKKVPLFASLGERGRKEIMNRLKPCMFHTGAVVIREGEEVIVLFFFVSFCYFFFFQGDKMYFIQAGTVRVMVGGKLVVKLTNGDFFGELAMLAPGGRRHASVVCETQSKVMSLNRRDFAGKS